jgi:hypothetical protein
MKEHGKIEFESDKSEEDKMSCHHLKILVMLSI